MLTGITNSMVAAAPPIESALPAFLEFAAGSVLVAHNAPFDVGFLRHFALEQGRPWPDFEVVDTAKLARRVVTRDESPNCKLASLARVFRSETTPNHRALADARATVDVLHGLIARLGSLGVHTLEELQTYSSQVSQAQRRKRHLAEGLPHAPGVYLFRDGEERVLYVGTSRDLRSRVRSYFTASETRSRMGEMIGLAESVTGIECATPLEGEVRELRLIGEHKPRYNRRSRFPEKTVFVKLTREPWPRLSVVRRVVDDGADYLGPFASRKVAERCVAALHEAFPVRQCSDRLPRRPARAPCVLAEMGRCLSPCDGSADQTSYAALVGRLREALMRRPGRGAVRAPPSRCPGWPTTSATRRPAPTATGSARSSVERRAPSVSRRWPACPSWWPPAATTDGRWAVHVVRHGRLAAAGLIPPGSDAHQFVAELRASAETVSGGPGPVPAASAEESERILRWLESPGVRLVHVEGEWSCPPRGAGRHLAGQDALRRSQDRLAPFDEPGTSRTVHRPVRRWLGSDL